MLFNSFEFGLFFVMVYTLYMLSRHTWQNRILLVASYLFYAVWDWRFLSLIWLSTVLDYFCGIAIQEASSLKRKKMFLWFSVSGNLLMLGFFKYFNFFIDTFQVLMASWGFNPHIQALHIILPVGISFYTFQTMSYTIDIYRGEMKPTKNFLDFSLFVSFFPQLVAGPIERAKNLLPQIMHERHITRTHIYEGAFLMFWGYFQKVFVADNLGISIVNPLFSQEGPYHGFAVLIGVYAFAFQILCDFAGYSNIARGLAKCMGIELMINFNIPYVSTCPSEFWKRWHISLSSWLKDYLYIPLGGNRSGSYKTVRNLMITMLLGGLWHGAGWTFIIWGAYHGLLLVVYRIIANIGGKYVLLVRFFSTAAGRLVSMIIFFHLTCVGWLVFRAQSLHQLGAMAAAFFRVDQWIPLTGMLGDIKGLIFCTALLIIVQMYQHRKNDLLAVYNMGTVPRILFYLICFFLIKTYGVRSGQEFIYFQF